MVSPGQVVPPNQELCLGLSNPHNYVDTLDLTLSTFSFASLSPLHLSLKITTIFLQSTFFIGPLNDLTSTFTQNALLSVGHPAGGHSSRPGCSCYEYQL